MVSMFSSIWLPAGKFPHTRTVSKISHCCHVSNRHTHSTSFRMQILCRPKSTICPHYWISYFRVKLVTAINSRCYFYVPQNMVTTNVAHFLEVLRRHHHNHHYQYELSSLLFPILSHVSFFADLPDVSCIICYALIEWYCRFGCISKRSTHFFWYLGVSVFIRVFPLLL